MRILYTEDSSDKQFSRDLFCFLKYLITVTVTGTAIEEIPTSAQKFQEVSWNVSYAIEGNYFCTGFLLYIMATAVSLSEMIRNSLCIMSKLLLGGKTQQMMIFLLYLVFKLRAYCL